MSYNTTLEARKAHSALVERENKDLRNSYRQLQLKYNEDVPKLKAQIEELQIELERKDEEISELNQQILKKDETISELEKKATSSDSYFSMWKRAITERNTCKKEIETLKHKLEECQKEREKEGKYQKIYDLLRSGNVKQIKDHTYMVNLPPDVSRTYDRADFTSTDSSGASEANSSWSKTVDLKEALADQKDEHTYMEPHGPYESHTYMEPDGGTESNFSRR